MKTANALRMISLSLVLVAFASCGGDKKSSSHEQQDQLCDDIKCMSQVSWKIKMVGHNFPDRGHAKVEINDDTVLNECVAKQRYSIDRSSEPQFLYLNDYDIPTAGKVKITIGDCTAASDTPTVYDNVQFETVKVSGTTEISIEL